MIFIIFDIINAIKLNWEIFIEYVKLKAKQRLLQSNHCLSLQSADYAIQLYANVCELKLMHLRRLNYAYETNLIGSNFQDAFLTDKKQSESYLIYFFF